MCKLHSEGETLGLSLLLHALTCSVATPVAGEPRRLAEAGQLAVGAVQAEISLKELEDCVPQRQWNFLRRADGGSRRLWFLWAEQSSTDCGCCGGCQFLDGSITRKPLQHRATPPSRPDPHPKHAQTLSLLSLKKSLQTVSLRDLACPRVLHTGLQAYYERPSLHSPSQPSTTGSDTESFASAKGSLSSTSDSDTNEFYSLENVNEAGLEGHTLPDDWREKQSTGTQTVLDPLYSLLSSYKYHAVALPIGGGTPTTLQSKVVYLLMLQVVDCSLQGQGDKPGHRRLHSDAQFSAPAVRAGHVRRSSDVPLTTPPTSQTKSYSLLRLPVVGQCQPGRLPTVNRPASAGVRETPGGSCQNAECHSRLNVEVKISGDVSAMLSPPTTRIISRSILFESVTSNGVHECIPPA